MDANTSTNKDNLRSGSSSNDWILVAHKKYKNNDLTQPKLTFGTKDEYITFKKNGKIKIY